MHRYIKKLAHMVRVRANSDAGNKYALSLSACRWFYEAIHTLWNDELCGWAYSVLAIDTLSSGYALTFSEENDFLAALIQFTLDDVVSVVLDVDGDLPEKIIDGNISGKSMINADKNLVDAAMRLLSMLDEPELRRDLEDITARTDPAALGRVGQGRTGSGHHAGADGADEQTGECPDCGK